MNANARKLKFFNFYKLYFPLTFNPEIGTEASMGKTDSRLTAFFIFAQRRCDTARLNFITTVNFLSKRNIFNVQHLFSCRSY